MEPNQPEQKQDSDIKVFAVLGYILPVMFFIPLLNDKMKEIPSVRFHANQQIILLIGYLCLMLLGNFMYLGFSAMLYSLIQLVNIGLLALGIYGAYNAYHDEMKPLPLIGHLKVLK